MGDTAKAKELAASSSALANGRANMVPVAEALAMAGDGTALRPSSTTWPVASLMTHCCTGGIPCVRALIELNRKSPDKAIELMKAATPTKWAILNSHSLCMFAASRSYKPIARRKRLRNFKGS